MSVTSSKKNIQVLTQFEVTIIADRALENMLPKKLFGKEYDYMYETFGCETECILPLYFDYKITNEF